MDGGVMFELTEAQAARRIQVLAARRALGAAPSVVGFARERIAGSFGGEAGVEVTQERTPLHTGWTDTADAAYAQLVDWVTYWAIVLDVPGPGVDSPWLRGEEVLGFRAGTTAEVATVLTRVQTSWLVDHLDGIEPLEAGTGFFADVNAIVWGLRAVVGMDRRDRPPAAPRECPVCGEFEVRGEFWGESITAAELRGDRWARVTDRDGHEIVRDQFLENLGRVTVRCHNPECEHEIEATEREKLRWLQ